MAKCRDCEFYYRYYWDGDEPGIDEPAGHECKKNHDHEDAYLFEDVPCADFKLKEKR